MEGISQHCDPDNALTLVAAAYGCNEGKIKAWAVRIAESYHSDHPLYTSAAGRVMYGTSRTVEDWDRYSRGWHRAHGPSRYKVAGVQIEAYAGKMLLVMTSTRGKVISLPLPPRDAMVIYPAMRKGDLYLLGADNRYERYDHHGKRTGVAVRSGAGWFQANTWADAEIIAGIAPEPGPNGAEIMAGCAQPGRGA